MSALTLSLYEKIDPALLNMAWDMQNITPDQLHDKSIEAIGQLTIQIGKCKCPLGKLFNISGQDTQDLVIEPQQAKLDNIGFQMKSGRITVKGNANHYAGFQMRGGELYITGHAADFAACELAGGQIIIEGNAGDFLGGALAGNKKGMRGGIVIIKGNVGERAGDQMRRGMILIEGNAGAYCASRMLAGTIGVMGSVGNYVAYGMRRGTLLLKQTPKMHATLNDCGSHTLPYLSLMFKSFATLPTTFSTIQQNRVRRYAGDIANDGKGEILVLQ